MNTQFLTASALFYLVTDRKCKLVTVERGLHWGNPDALGLTIDRYLVEIEVKTSLKDFLQNRKKSYIQYLEKGLGEDMPGLPAYYYFLVPPFLIEKIQPILPKYAGLLSVQLNEKGEPLKFSNGAFDIRSIVKAPRMKRQRLSAAQCIRLAKYQSMAFTVEMLRNAELMKQFKSLNFNGENYDKEKLPAR